MHKFISLFIISIIALAFNACSKEQEVQTAVEIKNNISGKLQTAEIDTSVFELQKVDINNDGKVDQYVYTKEGVIQYAKRDFNFDNLIDLTEFYENGEHMRDEIDLDYDGVCDLIVTYKNGIPQRKEYSVDFEANRHGVQIFDAEGNRIEIHRDLNADGHVDTIEFYKPNEKEPYKIQKN